MNKQLKELTYWNSRTYGSAITINRNICRGILILFLVLTPCTNWLIPFVQKIIKQDVKIRYEVRK